MHLKLQIERALVIGVLFLFILVVHKGWVGMSMEPDGLIYASVSAHLAEGIGSFWFPYSMFNEPSFHHHPPLAFGLQGLFFSALGSAYYVENLYQAMCLLAIAVLMCACWRQGARYSGRQSTGGQWFLLLLFFLMPMIAQSFTNNYLENTLTVFVLLAVYSFLRVGPNNKSLGWCLLAGISTLAALLVKGPVGLFPLAVLPIMYLAKLMSLGCMLRAYFVYLLVIVLGALAILLDDEARTSLGNYFDFQLVGTFEGLRPAVHDRAYMLKRLGTNLLGPAILVVLFLFYHRRVINGQGKGHYPNEVSIAPGGGLSNESQLWLLVALSASVPLLISPRHLSQYIVPSLPFYALFFSSLLRPRLQTLWLTPSLYLFNILRGLLVTLVVFTVGVSWNNFGVLERDSEEIGDMFRVMEIVPRGATIDICVSHDDIYRLLLYLSRHHSIRAVGMSGNEFVFCDNVARVPSGYTLVAPELSTISLYRRD